MDQEFIEAMHCFWDRRYDTLANELKKQQQDSEDSSKALDKLTATLSDEQLRLFLEMEGAQSKAEADRDEFYYNAGFKDAIKFLLDIMKEEGSDGYENRI